MVVHKPQNNGLILHNKRCPYIEYGLEEVMSQEVESREMLCSLMMS